MPMDSDAIGLEIPASTTGAALFSAAAAPSEEPDEIRTIWGTMVNSHDVMRMFQDFLQGFKPKYRVAHEREQGRPTRSYSLDESEELLYETYLRRMRQTGEKILNLDIVNILAYPPTKKLHNHLVKYPQEVVPMMDMVLKTLMLELADKDQEAEMEGMGGAEGDEEIGVIMSSDYRVHPFGLTSINMRDLNPTGTLLLNLDEPF